MESKVHAAEMLKAAARHPNYGDTRLLDFEKATEIALGPDYVKDVLRGLDGDMDAARRIMVRLQHESEDRQEGPIKVNIAYNSVTWYMQIDQGVSRFSGVQTESPSQAMMTAIFEWACAVAHREADAQDKADA